MNFKNEESNRIFFLSKRGVDTQTETNRELPHMVINFV